MTEERAFHFRRFFLRAGWGVLATSDSLNWGGSEVIESFVEECQQGGPGSQSWQL
jgi:hypothetical protein